MPKPLRATFAGAVSRSSANIRAVRPEESASPAPAAPSKAPAKAPPAAAPAKSDVVTTMVSETSDRDADARLAVDAVRVEDHAKPTAPLESDLESTLVSEEPPSAAMPLRRPSEPVVEVAAAKPAGRPAAPAAFGKGTVMGLGGTMMMDSSPPEPAAAQPTPTAKAAMGELKATPDAGLGGTLMLDEPGFEDAASAPVTAASAEVEPATLVDPSPLPMLGDAEAAPAATAAVSLPEPTADAASAAGASASQEHPEPPPPAPAPAPARAATSRSSGLLWLAVTALLVGTGIFFYLRLRDAPETAPLPPEPDPSADIRGSKRPTPDEGDDESTAAVDPTSEPTGSASAEPSADASAASTAAASAAPSATPTGAPTAEPSVPPTAAPSAPPTAGGDAAALPSDKGYLTVSSGAAAQVTLSGALVGSTNQRLEVRCGTAFVRLAKPGKAGEPMEWLTTGKPIVVECQQATSVSIEPGQ